MSKQYRKTFEFGGQATNYYLKLLQNDKIVKVTKSFSANEGWVCTWYYGK